MWIVSQNASTASCIYSLRVEFEGRGDKKMVHWVQIIILGNMIFETVLSLGREYFNAGKGFEKWF